MPHSIRKSSSSDHRPSAKDLVAYFLCFKPKPNLPDVDKSATQEENVHENYGLRYLPAAPQKPPPQDQSLLGFASDSSSSIYSQPPTRAPETSRVISYALSRMPDILRVQPSSGLPQIHPGILPSTLHCPQFYIMISGSFSASQTIFARRLFSNTSQPYPPLPAPIQEMLEEGIHSQIMNLMDRKLRDSLQLAAQTEQSVDEEYRISFFVGTLEGMSETKSYLGRQTKLLCAEEAREITTSLETIVARQIAIFDPPIAKPGSLQIVDILDSKPLMLTLRFDICDSGQKILVSRLVSCGTSTYPLPPGEEVRGLMQRIWRGTYEVVGRERLSRRDLRGFSEEEKEVGQKMLPYRFCVSFDVLFGDAEHKWFGGLCYGSRVAAFSDYTLNRLTRKVEELMKEQLAIFEVVGSLGWPQSRKEEAGFVTTDGLEEKATRGSTSSAKSTSPKTLWFRGKNMIGSPL